MKETLIEFETAKLAKQKGFDWGCKNFYDTAFGLYSFSECGEFLVAQSGDSIFDCNSEFEGVERLPAPTQSLLQKWLRDEHKIFVNPIPNFKTKVGQHHLGIVYMRSKNEVHSELLKNDDLYKSKKLFDTYEQALEQGLINALKLIK